VLTLQLRMLLPTQAVTDTSRPLEERMELLQKRFVAAMQEQQKHDEQVLELQAQLAASQQEADAGALGRAPVLRMCGALQPPTMYVAALSLRHCLQAVLSWRACSTTRTACSASPAP
jgi:hypothetical protein